MSAREIPWWAQDIGVKSAPKESIARWVDAVTDGMFKPVSESFADVPCRRHEGTHDLLRHSQLVVTSKAHDPDDARELLGALGLVPIELTRSPHRDALGRPKHPSRRGDSHG